MKKIFFVILTLFSILLPNFTFSCSIPPDILEEWNINTSKSHLEMTFTLLAWKNLHSSIQKTLENHTNIPLNEENLKQIVEKGILANTKLSLNNTPLKLTFQTGSIIRKNADEKYKYEPEPFLEAKFIVDMPVDFEKMQHFALHADKTPFLEISPLVHPYIVNDFQKNAFSEGYVIGPDKLTYDFFLHGQKHFVVRNETEELETESMFDLYVGPLTNEYKNPLNPNASVGNLQNNRSSNQQENIDIFAPKTTLKNFFSENISLSLQIFGIFIALISGIAHGLLPGHSKSLLVGYVASGGRVQKREVITLISSVTISHTLFIVILAGIILLFQKGTSFSASIVGNIGAIFYTIFGIFFLFQSLKFFLKKSNNLSQFGQKNHPNNCLCCQTKNTKNTIIVGFLAGLVPCIDALALFVAAMSIGNIFYSSMLIVTFSAGIGIMLAIIAFSLGSGKNFLHKKGSNFAEKFSQILTLFAGIFLIIMGISHFF